jgi:hypothetical protein
MRARAPLYFRGLTHLASGTLSTVPAATSTSLRRPRSAPAAAGTPRPCAAHAANWRIVSSINNRVRPDHRSAMSSDLRTSASNRSRMVYSSISSDPTTAHTLWRSNPPDNTERLCNKDFSGSSRALPVWRIQQSDPRRSWQLSGPPVAPPKPEISRYERPQRLCQQPQSPTPPAKPFRPIWA